MHRSKWRLIGLAVTAFLGLSNVSAQAAKPAYNNASEALRSLAPSSHQLKAFYARGGYQPIWFSGQRPTPAATQLLDLMGSAELDGLDARDYRLDRLREAVEAARTGSSEDVARAEVAISRTLLSYVRDLHRKTNSDLAYVDKALRPSPPSITTTLDAAAAGGSIAEIVQMHPLYIQLRAGYAAWRDRWANAPDITVPAGAPLGVGAKGDRVSLLRSRLGLPSGGSFDAKLAAQVRSFKEAHGLPATAVVDAQTIALLNEPRGAIDARIRLNLARSRQLPPPSIGRHLIVDAAGQRLLLYDGARLVDSMKVIVGKPTEPTPMLAALIRYTTINPYWNVPPDLVASRIAQNVLSDGLGYLQVKGYQIMSDWSPTATPLDPTTIDWQAAAAGKLDLPVRQLPGPGNMMGAMKFMFPNKFGVYLHDTPDKGLFSDTDRRKSSGCVRLEDAARLARWLYGSMPQAPRGSGEYNVPLDRPVPVYITYLTAAPTQGGVAFRDDVYGRDRLSGARLASAS
jgi:murein L,D-transpeptidase YcbB/YkuD